ncbi:hypothetical protein AAL_06294 [Moelleriella libera RCEF 2490]|uniref:Uncharacterized protein n=1 Tax=Moelleriella libera RCEF 2490 TaxID=1081109 RepID=A0A167Z2S3_9HYPO|nr:hypothetical protein AAL_06294 [Moelleriella libera RCEF 2490]
MAQTSAKLRKKAENLQISPDELFTFHETHFSANALAHFSADFLPSSEIQQSNDQSAHGVWQSDWEDDLGFYDDGTKRTLTDEQIKIFRHSELRELRKNREKTQSLRASGCDADVLNGELECPEPKQNRGLPGHRGVQKRKKGIRAIRQEPKPDLRKRTWDVVDAGVDSLDYD